METVQPTAVCTGHSCGAKNTTVQDVTWNDSDRLLRQLNDDKARLYIPVVLYILILLVTGVIGNSLVLYVYLKRFKRTSSNYFILSMAMFDMVSCCIGMPTEIYDLRYPYMFYSNAACKILRYTESVTIIGSVFILVAVAVDRCFKICKPFRNTSLRVFKKICLAIVAFSFLTVIPSIFVSGVVDVKTDFPGVVGRDCSVVKTLPKGSVLVWYGFLMVQFTLCSVTMIALYIRIWFEIKRRQKQVISSESCEVFKDHGTLSRSPTPLSPVDRSVTDVAQIKGESVARIKYLPSTSISVSSDPDSSGLHEEETRSYRPCRLGSNSSDGLDAERKSLRQIGEHMMTKIRVSKTTVMLFVVTLAFILSYLPTLIVMVTRSKGTKSRTDASDFLMKLLSKSYFINNSINPIIYSFLNRHFRTECAKALSRLYYRCFYCCHCDS
ncbi:orexin receptor type 2-like [Liolophura sinensis]|uniref:orexin receptor type 2-like n=1 Tax=Liolophura sinensis TaxID=3198878 RepID=UPI0031599502